MKRSLLICILALSTLSASAEAFLPDYYSPAATDDARAVIVNPAAMAFGNGNGIGLFHSPGDVFSEEADFSDNWYLFGCGRYFGAVIGLEEQQWYKSIAVSAGPLFNTYTGAGYSWLGSSPSDGKLSVGLLSRPLDALSIGAVYRTGFPVKSELTAGIGLRPLWFSENIGHRLEIGTDIGFTSEGAGLPVIYIRTEPFDGITLAGRYDFAESLFSISLAAGTGNLLTEGRASVDLSGSALSQSFFIQLNPREYAGLPVRGPGSFINYAPPTVVTENPGSLPPEFSFLTGEGLHIREIISQINALAADDRIGGLVFRNRLFSASRANFNEIERALLDFRAAGKKIVFYFEIADTANYTLAAAVADQIYLNPSGSLALSGTGSVRFYFNDLLTKFGIRTVDLQSHEYKTANNRYTRPTMTGPEREALTEVYTGLQEETERRIEAGRGGRLTDSAFAIFNHGPYLLAEDALAAGLIDGLLYEGDLDVRIAEDFGGTEVRRIPPADKIRRDWADPWPGRIAVVYATGAIYPGEAVPGRAVGSDTVVRALREAREDPLTRAIVLRVDSPGGSALASDVIAREVAVCRGAPYNLPVVVSMGAVAGSGGYYISCTSDYIFAEADTITGSIGVTAFSLDIEKMLDDLGIGAVSLFTRENSDIGNFTREMSEQEYETLRAYILETYDIFVNTVADGRGMSYDQVHNVAQGRIWTGKKALELGLVDEIGGFGDAVGRAALLAGIKNDVELVTFTGHSPAFGSMDGLFRSRLIEAGLPEPLLRLASDFEILLKLNGFQALTLMPADF